MNTREHATVASVSYGVEDHGILTSYVQLKLQTGVQGFGGLALDERTGKSWRMGLAEFFGAAKFEDIVGCQCWALRCWPTWGTTIEGLENTAGDRFTMTKFRRLHWPEKKWDPLEDAVQRAKSSIAHLTRRINEETAGLDKLRTEYVDWNGKP